MIYPEELDCGPFPIVFMMHGSHATCFQPPNNGISQQWPCPEGRLPLPNHQGYRYLAELLASHGIFTVSISANSINANDAANVQARAELFWTHPGKVEAPYTVCIASASNLTGLVKSSVECRRTGL